MFEGVRCPCAKISQGVAKACVHANLIDASLALLLRVRWGGFSYTFKASSNFLPCDLAVQVFQKTHPWHLLTLLLTSPWVGRSGEQSWGRGSEGSRGLGLRDQNCIQLSVWPWEDTYKYSLLQEEGLESDYPKKSMSLW